MMVLKGITKLSSFLILTLYLNKRFYTSVASCPLPAVTKSDVTSFLLAAVQGSFCLQISKIGQIRQCLARLDKGGLQKVGKLNFMNLQ